MRFSKRTDWPQSPNAWSQLIENKRKNGEALWDLTVSDPTHCQLAYTEGGSFEDLSDPDNVFYEPHPQGLLSARKAVAEHYHRSRHTTLSPEHIFLTSGTSEAYSFLFKLLVDTHEEVLCPAPSYPLMELLGELNDVAIKKYFFKRRGDGWSLDKDSLVSRITDRTRAVVVIHPNNPTGHYLEASEKQFLEELAVQKKFALIADEVFWDYPMALPEERIHFAMDTDQALVFTLNGISKLLGLPQMKLSWITIHGPKDIRDEAGRRLSVISDTFLSVNTPVQRALPRWFEKAGMIQKEISRRVYENWRSLKEAIDPAIAECLPVQGGWYALIKVAGSCDDEKVSLHLLETQNVLVHPGYLFDFPDEGYLGISLLPPKTVFQEAVRRLVQGLAVYI